MAMRALGKKSAVRKVASVLALALFFAGTNYCLLNVIPGLHGCGMAMASTPQASAANASRHHGCPECPACPDSRPASKPAANDPPCCLVYGPAPAPAVAAELDRLPPTLMMAVLVAPLSLDLRASAMAHAHARRDDPPEERDFSPRPSRAPPLL
jgi:hypothetical protein